MEIASDFNIYLANSNLIHIDGIVVGGDSALACKT